VAKIVRTSKKITILPTLVIAIFSIASIAQASCLELFISTSIAVGSSDIFSADLSEKQSNLLQAVKKLESQLAEGDRKIQEKIKRAVISEVLVFYDEVVGQIGHLTDQQIYDLTMELVILPLKAKAENDLEQRASYIGLHPTDLVGKNVSSDMFILDFLKPKNPDNLSVDYFLSEKERGEQENPFSAKMFYNFVSQKIMHSQIIIGWRNIKDIAVVEEAYNDYKKVIESDGLSENLAVTHLVLEFARRVSRGKWTAFTNPLIGELYNKKSIEQFQKLQADSLIPKIEAKAKKPY